MYHLRQDKPLTEKSQEDYFIGPVARLFDQEKPNQILFSYLKNDKCIGYGGLVHINWIDMNAEISFIVATELEEDNFVKRVAETVAAMIASVKVNDKTPQPMACVSCPKGPWGPMTMSK